jgi:hypothetical protein
MQLEARKAALLRSSVSCRPSWTDKKRFSVGPPLKYDDAAIQLLLDQLDDDDDDSLLFW